jgi:hypothetical protein
MKNVHIAETSGLFLEIYHDSGPCYYWFADHASRIGFFWLHPVDTINRSRAPEFMLQGSSTSVSGIRLVKRASIRD